MLKKTISSATGIISLVAKGGLSKSLHFLANSLPSIQSSYVSPYKAKMPLDYIVVHNRSKNAVNYAIRQLKDAWPNIKIIHVVQENRAAIPGADSVVRIKDWSSMEHFKRQFDGLIAIDPNLRKSMSSGKVGFYSVWSAQAENSKWAISAQEAGFKWIGASPDKMKGLDKIEYKKLCQQKGLPTAAFVEIKPPLGITEKEAAFKIMAEDLVKQLSMEKSLSGKPVFVKHNEGGGGRGTKKVVEINVENGLEAIRKIVNETGGNLNGVYAEQALDLEGALMLQIEIECDASSMAPGGRLVWFNKDNQKVLEVGFTDSSILQLLPKDIYEGCREASAQIFAASGYDSRGTNEILIVKDKHGSWSFKLLELNKRIQVENEALSELVTDLHGHPKNVAAEQVMRAMGYPPPKLSDFREKGPAILAHVRLLSCEITATGSLYPSGLEIDGAIYPQGANVQFARGPVYLDADPQIGRALISAETWEDFCNKLLMFAQEFQFYGPKTEASTYFDFLRKLAADPVFRAGKLGCNNTFNVLTNPPVEKGSVQQIIEALSNTVTPLVTHGYRPNEGVKDQPYPTVEQNKEFSNFMDRLNFEQAPTTPFSKFLAHHNFKNYILDLKDQLSNHGGGTVTVIRDVLQSTCDQESALIQPSAAKIAEIYFAGSGIGVGFETGGAQYQAALMRKFDWMSILLAGCTSNLPSHSLTRSKWLNGLTIKSAEEQAFVFRTIANEVLNLYGLSFESNSFIPWFPYNFHAGNHPEQDITTREMLKANLGVIPNWAWDPRYSEEHFKSWIKRQLALFKDEGKPLNQIRIKNPGQGPNWTSRVIVKMVQTILQMFKDHDQDEPVIFIHNHDFNGMAAHIAVEALRECQKLGYSLLIIDSAPPGTSHNSNILLSKAFSMSAEERDNLNEYNHGTQLALNLTSRFNNQNLTRGIQDPDSEMAGGTNSSDLNDAIKMGVPPHQMNKAIALGRALTGLGTAVTPYSEWIKQIGFAIWNNQDIQPKTIDAATNYIDQRDKLAIATPILEGLQKWETLLPRNELVKQLLINHGMLVDLTQQEYINKPPIDFAAKRTELQTSLSRTKVGDREISTAIAFDKIGLASLEHRDHANLADGPRDMTIMVNSPDFVHSQFKKEGDTFHLKGEKITINKIKASCQTGLMNVDYNFQGHNIRTSGINPDLQAKINVNQVRKVKDKKMEFGAPMAGRIINFFVKPGEKVRKGQLLAVMEAMKMEHSLKAEEEGLIVDTVKSLEGESKNVEGGEVVLTFRK